MSGSVVAAAGVSNLRVLLLLVFRFIVGCSAWFDWVVSIILYFIIYTYTCTCTCTHICIYVYGWEEKERHTPNTPTPTPISISISIPTQVPSVDFHDVGVEIEVGVQVGVDGYDGVEVCVCHFVLWQS